MQKLRKFFILGLFLSISLLFSARVFAHSLWLNTTDYTPEFHPEYGANTKVYFGWGHHYPVDDFLSEKELKEFSLVYPDGKRKKITPGLGGFLATEINFKKPGLHIVSASKKPGFYTMYIERGKIHHKIGPKTGLKGVILSLYYEQYAKCLINVGSYLDDDSFKKPVGHKLEIIPLENPYKLRGCGGHFLPVKVLFNGKPARYCKVYATYAGFSTSDDFAYATSTDSEGIARIRITHWGVHLIKARMELPASDDLKDKCNKLSYTATLTFEIL